MASGTISTGLMTSEIQTIENILGNKNIANFGYTTQTVTTSGISVTFIVDSDKTVTVNGDGTISDRPCFIETRFDLPKGHYILNGCPKGGNDTNKYRQRIFIESNSQLIGSDTGDGVEFTLNNDERIVAYIAILVGYTFTEPLVFKPMIRPASIQDDTYVPYAMTNRELTERLIYDTQQTTIIGVPSKEWKDGTIYYSLPSGYKIGSVTITTSTGTCIACLSAITSGTIFIYAHNMGNSSIDVTVTATILYIKE